MPRPKKPNRLEMPAPIEADADTVTEVVLRAPPKETWRFEEEYKRKHGSLPK